MGALLLGAIYFCSFMKEVHKEVDRVSQYIMAEIFMLYSTVSKKREWALLPTTLLALTLSY